MLNATFTDILKRDLLTSYDKFARPNVQENTTSVKMSLSLVQIEIDEIKSILTTKGWLSMQWKDDKLRWNVADYGNLSSIHLAYHEIWQPDILLFNSASGSLIDHYGDTHCIIWNSGLVMWVPPSTFLSFCQLNMKYWPYDSHTCGLTLGSWTYSDNHVDLVLDDPSIKFENIVKNHEWKIINHTSERSADAYVKVQLNFTIERRAPMFKAVALTPATIMILMTLSSFWLPAQSGEKILLNGINALIIVIFLVYFAEKLPIMANHTPLVVLFYSNSLYMVAFSMIISIIVINLSRNQSQPVANFVKNGLNGNFGKFLGLNHINVQQIAQQKAQELQNPPFIEEHNTILDDQPGSKELFQHNWILLATAIDRVAFLIYCLVFAILAISHSI